VLAAGILASGPGWSPVDDRIAFAGQTATQGSDIFTIRANGTERTDLTPTALDQRGPIWSHDGSRIAYTTDPPEPPPWDPYRAAIVAADGSPPWVDPLHHAIGGVWDWAPDDSSLLVGDYQDTQLLRMNPSTGSVATGPYLGGMGGSFAWESLHPGLRMVGASGHDQLYGSWKNDKIYGQGGPDSLYGGNGADLITGGDGNDLIAGGYGSDFLYGGPGNETIYAADHIPDHVDCGPGNDTAWVDASDTVVGCETVHGP
jgi:Ca2+-binding RTX toxin-like protein